MAREPLLTLEQAIKDKYCRQENEEEVKEKLVVDSKPGKSISESALCYRPGTLFYFGCYQSWLLLVVVLTLHVGNCPVQHLSSVLLDGKEVNVVGEEESLAQLCPRAEELHLSSNSITLWKDVCTKLL